ncbi:hypothetical protein K525DRAFT_264142 [Schizophyllum commune Loenen D]|nr:hypothetical protein K525DRAFT_264142 [Schizophyllum commune Loenen D]
MLHSSAFAAARGAFAHAATSSAPSFSTRSLYSCASRTLSASRPMVSGPRRIALTWPLPVPPASCFTTSAKADHHHHHHHHNHHTDPRDAKSDESHVPHWSYWQSRWGRGNPWVESWWGHWHARHAMKKAYYRGMYARGCPMTPAFWWNMGMPEGAGATEAGASKAGKQADMDAKQAAKEAHMMEMRGSRWGGKWGHRHRGRDFDGYGSSRWPHHFGKHFGRRGPRFFPFFFLSIPFLFCVPFFFPAFIFLLAAPFMFIMSIPIIMLHFFLDILFWIF